MIHKVTATNIILNIAASIFTLQTQRILTLVGQSTCKQPHPRSQTYVGLLVPSHIIYSVAQLITIYSSASHIASTKHTGIKVVLVVHVHKVLYPLLCIKAVDQTPSLFVDVLYSLISKPLKSIPLS